MNNERQSGLDIIKAFATFAVVAVHFYLSVGYYKTPLISEKMYVMTYVRWFFMIAVPLFLMATGYFKINKLADKRHYMSLIPIIITYVILCTIRMIVENAVYGQIHTFESAVKGLLNYQCAWYVGMYIGLMLLCPFLNKAWKACDRREHILLVLSLVVITMVYPIVQYIFPSYFQMLYPITYYYMGAYIREYKPSINKILLIVIALACTGINTGITLRLSMGGPFAPGFLAAIDNGQNSITIAISAACVFLFFYNVKIKNKVISTLFKSMSNCSLEIYLLQAAFNAIIYTYLGRIVTDTVGYFWLFFVTVPISFVCSWVTAAIYKWLYSSIASVFKHN